MFWFTEFAGQESSCAFAIKSSKNDSHLTGAWQKPGWWLQRQREPEIITAHGSVVKAILELRIKTDLISKGLPCHLLIKTHKQNKDCRALENNSHFGSFSCVLLRSSGSLEFLQHKMKIFSIFTTEMSNY